MDKLEENKKDKKEIINIIGNQIERYKKMEKNSQQYKEEVFKKIDEIIGMNSEEINKIVNICKL